jgi:hypothetical protein
LKARTLRTHLLPPLPRLRETTWPGLTGCMQAGVCPRGVWSLSVPTLATAKCKYRSLTGQGRASYDLASSAWPFGNRLPTVAAIIFNEKEHICSLRSSFTGAIRWEPGS